MRILNNAAKKIQAFNSNPKDRPRESYHRVLLARAGRKSFVGEDGSVSDEQHLRMIDWALRSYFMMNRGKNHGSMGSKEEFVSKLVNKLGSDEIRRILVRFTDLSIMSPSLEDCKSDAEGLYESLSNREDGLSANGTYFYVGTTKVIHCLFPELFVLLDSKVAKVVLVRSYGYNNFSSYWKVMEICRGELVEWQELYGSTDSLLQLDTEPTTLTRIFDKCAHAMAMDK